MRLIGIGLLTHDPFYWKEHVKETLEFCDEYLVFQYGNNEESAKIASEAGAIIVDTPIDYLGTSDVGTGFSTLHLEAIAMGADAVFMGDPTDKWIGDLKEVKHLLKHYEVVRSKLFRCRVTEEDEDAEVFDRKWFEPEYNYKVMFAQAKTGRVYWAMYHYWPYGALSFTEHGLVKSYAMAQSKDAFRVVTLGSADYAEKTQEVLDRAEDWIARNNLSQEGNPLITEDEFETKGVAL